MAVTYYVDDVLELDVENPGHGEIFIYSLERGRDYQATLRGAQLGQALIECTQAALQDTSLERGDTARPQQAALPAWVLIPATARRLLPALQKAVLLATAGIDRYERVVVDEDDMPAPPLCVNCNEGSDYHQAVTVSERCVEHGHSVFGEAYELRWDRAVQVNERDREWWRTMQSVRGRT